MSPVPVCTSIAHFLSSIPLGKTDRRQTLRSAQHVGFIASLVVDKPPYKTLSALPKSRSQTQVPGSLAQENLILFRHHQFRNPSKMLAILIRCLLLSLLSSLTAATAIPRSPSPSPSPSPSNYVPPGQCCFTLADASTGQTVQQDQRTGYLYLGSSHPDGWYCLDLAAESDVLRDDFDNACFLSPTKQFKCLDPIPGLASWALGGSNELTHDGDAEYLACDAGDESGELLWADGKSDGSGCRSLEIEAQGF